MIKLLIILFKNYVFQVRKSDDRTVVLNNLHVDMTGRYTCEVSTEGIFETVKESAKMTVIGKSINKQIILFLYYKE